MFTGDLECVIYDTHTTPVWEALDFVVTEFGSSWLLDIHSDLPLESLGRMLI